MLRILILALALAAGVSSAAQAQVFVVQSCGATGVSLPLGPGGRFVQQIDGTLCTIGGSGGGGGGATGSVTAPGTNGTQAQAVQGINGGIPQNSYTGQYNTTLPTFANGQSGYVALDVNGRQILSPTVTLPISAASLPLPTGAATAANQNSTAAGTSATSGQGVQGVTGGVPVGVSLPTGAQTTTGALQPPTAASGKITQTQISVAATTSTQLVAANTARIVVEIQCDGTAPVGIDRTGGTLTSGTAAPLVIPSGSYPLYTMPIATQTAITAYTATAQSCRVTEYLR